MFKLGKNEKKGENGMKKNGEKSLKKEKILSLEKRERRRVVIKTAAGVLASAIIAGGGCSL